MSHTCADMRLAYDAPCAACAADPDIAKACDAFIAEHYDDCEYSGHVLAGRYAFFAGVAVSRKVSK